jgi:hypothetical protein
MTKQATKSAPAPEGSAKVRTDIELAFADGVYLFKFGIPQIEEIQKAAGVGIGAVYANLIRGRYLFGAGPAEPDPIDAEYRHENIVNVIRQGLIGGGKGVVDGQEVTVTAYRANQLVENYLLQTPIAERWALAFAALTAPIQGVPDDRET